MKQDKKNYSHLIGADKEKIKELLGEEYNFYPADKWTYILGTNWLGRKKILALYFKDQHVVRVETKTSWKD